MAGVEQGRRRRRGAFVDVAVPIVAAAVPTAVFQVPAFFVAPPVRASIVAVGLLVFAAVVVFQIARGRRQQRAQTSAEDRVAHALATYEVAVQYAFGQVATRLVRFAGLERPARRYELGAFADRVAAALAYYLLAHVADVRANVYMLSADLRQLVPIGHGGAGDTAGTFRAGTPFGDRNLEWVLEGGAPRVVNDRAAEVDADEDEPGFAPRYQSYVSVVVRSEEYSYGMLTVDTPATDVFTDLDIENVQVMAEYLAVAFALTYPEAPVSAPGPTLAP